MAKNYSSLTGAKIVRSIRSRRRGTLFVCILGFGFCILLVAGMIEYIRSEHEYLVAIGGMAMAGFGGWYAVYQLLRQIRVLRDVQNCRLFRKYGTPDELARTIAEESASPLLESKQTLLTPSFIMKYGDFESFMRCCDIVLMYRKEHRTNGILDAVYLVCHDKYGDSFDYPFKIGKKHTGKMDAAVNEIVKSCPDCRFGYTTENLNFVKQNAQNPE